MKPVFALFALSGIVLTVFVAWSFWEGKNRRHDPVEYYRGWGGYAHPIGLDHKITREEADALASRGGVFMIGHFSPDGRLMRATKMEGGSVFFDFEYAYHPNGKLRSARLTNAEGVTTVREHDTSGRGDPGAKSLW